MGLKPRPIVLEALLKARWQAVIPIPGFFRSTCGDVCQSFCKIAFHNVEAHETHGITACIHFLPGSHDLSVARILTLFFIYFQVGGDHLCFFFIFNNESQENSNRAGHYAKDKDTC